MLKKSTFVIFAIFVGLMDSSFADETQPEPTSDYGQVYVIEKSLHEVQPWRFGLNYGYEFGNSYQDVHVTTLIAEHSLGRFAWIGVQTNVFISSSTSLMRTLSQQLQVQGVGINAQVPNYSIYPVFTWNPLGGHMSFLGNRPLEAELGIKIGGGYISYAGSPARFGLLWSIRPVVHFSEQWSAQGGFGQEIEAPFSSTDRLFHLRGELGISYQL